MWILALRFSNQFRCSFRMIGVVSERRFAAVKRDHRSPPIDIL
jgi:hypothetical protein